MRKVPLDVGNPVHVAWQPRIALRNDEDDTDSDSDSEDIRTKLQKNSEGDMYVDLGKKKRVTVRSFKGKPPLPRLRTCRLLNWQKEQLWLI